MNIDNGFFFLVFFVFVLVDKCYVELCYCLLVYSVDKIE